MNATDFSSHWIQIHININGFWGRRENTQWCGNTIGWFLFPVTQSGKENALKWKHKSHSAPFAVPCATTSIQTLTTTTKCGNIEAVKRTHAWIDFNFIIFEFSSMRISFARQKYIFTKSLEQWTNAFGDGEIWLSGCWESYVCATTMTIDDDVECVLVCECVCHAGFLFDIFDMIRVCRFGYRTTNSPSIFTFIVVSVADRMEIV